jgi:hypothetical protein
MERLVALLGTLAFAVNGAGPEAPPPTDSALPIEAQEQRIDAADALARSCRPEGLHALFALSASGAIDGVGPMQDLSHVNGLAALRCPRAFVRQLAAESAATRGRVLECFWVPDRESELRSALQPLRADPALRTLIDRELLPRLDTR